MVTDTISDKRWVCLRWKTFGGYYYVGPFADSQGAAEWADENQGIDVCWEVGHQARTEDEGWQVLWQGDPTAPAPLLTLAEGVAEAARRDEAWRRVARQSEWWRAMIGMGINLDVAEQRREQEE